MDQEGLKKGQEGLKLAVLDKKKARQLDGALFIKCLPKVAQRPPVCNKKNCAPGRGDGASNPTTSGGIPQPRPTGATQSRFEGCVEISRKLNFVLPVLPPLTPKTPVIGPLPKPAAFTAYSQLQGLPSSQSSRPDPDFDDPFEPEAEVAYSVKWNPTIS